MVHRLPFLTMPEYFDYSCQQKNWFIFYFAIYEKCQVIVLNKLLTQFPEFQSAELLARYA